MGVSITEDESDKKAREAKEVGADIVRRHSTNRTSAAEEIRARRMQLDRTAILNPRKEKRYHLVNRTKDGEYIGMRQGQGYELTPVDDKAQLAGRARNNKEAQVVGDLVLMETSVENYEEGRKMRREMFERMYAKRNDEAREKINKTARDGGLVGPHVDAVIE